MRARATLAALAALLAGAPPAAADWAPPVELSAVGGSARLPQAAMAVSGVATVVWEGEDGPDRVIQARRIDAAGGIGPVIDVSEDGEDGSNAHVAVDAAGNATVVWERRAGLDWIVRARRITAAGGLEAARDLSEPGASARLPRVAVDAAGRAAVLWRAEGTAELVQGRRIDAAGVLGPVLDLSAPGDMTGHELAIDASGRAFAVWSRIDGAASLVEGRSVDAAGALGPVRELSAAGEAPDVAMAPGGDRTVVWTTPGRAVQARRVSAADALGPVIEVTPAGDAPQVAVDPSGSAAVVWEGGGEAIELRRIAAGGALGAIQPLSDGGENETPSLDVDGHGAATVAWRSFGGVSEGARARTIPAAGAPEPPQDVSGPREEIERPRVATNATGAAVVAWSEWDGARYVVAGARWTPPPDEPPVEPPAEPSPEGPAATPLPGGPPPAERCRVPRLAGLALATARKRLRRAGCRLGKVKRPRARTHKRGRLVVRRASRRPGTVLPRNAPVRLTLKWRPR